MFYDGPGVQRALARDLFCYVEHRTPDCCGFQRFEQSLHSSVVRAHSISKSLSPGKVSMSALRV